MTGDADRRVSRTEVIISGVLRIGVSVSLFLVVVGALIEFAGHPAYFSSTAQLEWLTRPGALFPHTLGAIIGGLRHLDGQAVIALGLLLLIATPVTRVAVSIFIFLYQDDRTFVLITTLVLLLLILSFVLGYIGGQGPGGGVLRLSQ